MEIVHASGMLVYLSSSKKLVLTYQTTWYYNPEGNIMKFCHCESFRPFIKICIFFGQFQGFKAQVTREPTDIVVKFPTPPPPQEQVQQPQYIAVSPLSYDTNFLWKIAQESLTPRLVHRNQLMALYHYLLAVKSSKNLGPHL
jgi:hypothetical protein